MIFLRYLVVTAIAILFAFTVSATSEVDGLITQPSANSVDVTIEKFEEAATKRGLKVFARLDHAAAAESVGLEMPQATVIVFGNPRVGTPVFIETPTVAIDLPPKAMVWEDSDGKVFLSYNSAEFLFDTIYARHGIESDRAVKAKVASLYADIADEAVN
ncbi:DUF302 domain-containing protein [Pleurocapsales cyanobacterium LEGE 10410]|nr:DUF302 domain-containing protein [Pleurocapsales cyanobacterium LEGE 10410]